MAIPTSIVDPAVPELVNQLRDTNLDPEFRFCVSEHGQVWWGWSRIVSLCV